jgi:hypothetical protein
MTSVIPPPHPPVLKINPRDEVAMKGYGLHSVFRAIEKKSEILNRRQSEYTSFLDRRAFISTDLVKPPKRGLLASEAKLHLVPSSRADYFQARR